MNGDVLRAPQPDSEMSGLERFIAARPGWDATFLRGASAPAGGPLIADVFNRWIMDVETSLRRGKFDAVYLSLHGACQAEGDPSADLSIMRRVRAAAGRTPVVATFDMHANLSAETALLLDGASANRMWPHGGGAAAADRTLRLLEGILSGATRPIGALARVPSMMAALHVREALADAWTHDLPRLGASVLDASVFGGFAWGDSPYAGPSALVWADRDAGLARATAERLAARLAAWRPADQAMAVRPERLLATALMSGSGPFVLLDTADDPMAGGLGDTPGLLSAMLDAGLDGEAAFGVMHDADMVGAACEAGAGGHVTRPLGGRMSELYGKPIHETAEVVRLVDAPASAADGMPANGEAGGKTGVMAVLRMRGIDILVSSTRPGMPSRETFARAGIDLDRLRVLGAKGGETARTALSPSFATIIDCACAGPAQPDITRLPFRDVPPQRRQKLAPRQQPVSVPLARALPNWMALDQNTRAAAATSPVPAPRLSRRRSGSTAAPVAVAADGD